jgi:hypothetical protein
MIEHAGGIIENQSIDLANTDNDLKGMAKRVGGCDKQGDDEAERSPCESGDGLHAENKRIRGQVPAV